MTTEVQDQEEELIAEEELELTAEEIQDQQDHEAYAEALKVFLLDQPVKVVKNRYHAMHLAPSFVEQHKAEPWLQRMALNAVTARVRGDLYDVTSPRKPKYIIDDELEDVRKAVKKS